MTNGYLVNHDVDERSVSGIQDYYDRRLIPPEKKPFLIDLAHCAGPLLAIDGQHYILDVASQIASKGLGFNAGAMFGAAQFIETWTGCPRTPLIGQIRTAFAELLQGLIDWPELHLQLCNSGAEAIETALGLCYRDRRHHAAKRVLAFEGAFHGRMMVALASTWTASKREPFAWEGFETSFAPYPVLKDGDDVNFAEIPKGWREAWANAHNRSTDAEGFAKAIRSKFGNGNALLKCELESLLAVRRMLLTDQHYAVLVEPMQCEGGDRYSTARFHNGLINLTKAFGVALVYDEIQTGFGLGGEFFWHRKFDLRDEAGMPLAPDHVVLAKKAQVGVVLSHQPCDFDEQYNTASLTRGFIHASMIDQFRAEIDLIEARNRVELAQLVQRYPQQLSRARACGLSFAFDFADAEKLKEFVSHRFRFGLLYYPAGERAARFRFNLALRGDLIDIAWRQINAAIAATLAAEPLGAASEQDKNPVAIKVPDVGSYLEFHQQLIAGKLMSLRELAPLSGGANSFLTKALKSLGIDAEVVFLTEANWSDYRQQVWDLQGIIYEPLRQTEIEKFDKLIQANNALAIAVVKDGAIISMAFAAPPANFPDEGGVAEDPWFNDRQTIYMLDLTVVPEYRGRLGRTMKQAFCLAAQAKGLQAIQGRNRDRLARGMWAINLSLGSYCTRVLKDDYQDEHPNRDCLMYRCELDWKDEPIHLSSGVSQPLDSLDLNEDFCHANLSLVTNKLTLSNFVTADYLRQLDRVFGLLPENLRHGYTASGMSECVDKLVKSIWLARRPKQKMIVIGSAYFGHGSFLSRTLSGVDDSLFASTTIPVGPGLLGALESALASDDALAVFVEPLGCMSGQRIDKQTLIEISRLCKKRQTPLVSHDSAGMFHRYSSNTFLPSSIPGFQPDAGMIFLGGQMAVSFMTEEYFVDTPLMFISTWDGDCLSLAQFDHALTCAEMQSPVELMNRYHHVLTKRLDELQVTEYSLEGGVGWFRGHVDPGFAALFRQTDDGRYLSCPSVGAIRKFLAHVEHDEID